MGKEDGIEPKVGVILLNYNNYQDTLRCVDSLNQVDYQNYIIIIVDNCSTNESVTYLNEIQSNKTIIIKSDINGGFAYGNNLGIDMAIKNSCDYVLLLNNDTIVDKRLIKELVACCDYTQDLGIATARIMYENERNKIWYAGGDIDWENERATHLLINDYYSADYNNEIRRVGFASGCCMLIPIAIILEGDKLPEDYFMYYEDVDYCLSVREKGKEILYNPNALVYHRVSGAGGGMYSPFTIECINRSRRIFIKKYRAKMCWRDRTINRALCEIKEIVRILILPNKLRGIRAYIKSYF